MRWTLWRTVLIISAVSIFYLAILFFDRRDVMEVRNVTIDPPAVKAGEKFTFEFDARPLRDNGCEGVSIPSIIDSAGTEHLFNDPIKLDRKKDEWQHYSRVIESPPKAALGKARYVRNIKHWCFFLQQIWPIREHRETTYTVIP